MAVNPLNISFNDPLYLHPSDTPGVSLVQDPLIGNENYGVWSRAMLLALRAKNKLGFITGSYRKPAENHPTLHQWDRCNAIVLSWIMSSVSKEIFGGASNISTYFSHLKKLWDEYASLVTLPSCSCDTAKAYVEHDQQQHLLQFLMGLNESYGHIRSQIILMTPLPSVNQAYSILSQEESHRNVLSSPVNMHTAAFYSSLSRGNDSMKCENCKIPGHTKDQCFRLIGYPQGNDSVKCENCNIPGHTKDQCFRLIGYPPGHKLYKRFPQNKNNKFNQKPFKASANHTVASPAASDVSHECSFTDDQYHQILRLLNHFPSPTEPTTNLAGNFTSLMTLTEPDEWILDSGAKAHITGTSSVLQNPKPCDSSTGSIRLPNGKTTIILSTGSIKISPSCTLPKVLHVPDFSFNLISISQFTEDHQCFVVFYPNFCLFQDLLTGKITGTGKQKHGLYYLDQFPVNIASVAHSPLRPCISSCNNSCLSNPCVFSACKDDDIDTWHKRFGHLSISRLQCLSFIKDKSLTMHCPIFPLAKQTRNPFPTRERSKSTRIFQLLHVDIWGPYRTQTHSGARFFLTLVDDFSRCT
ncbi:uncharacterized protein LOC142550277 [Primulina tabacum]|uniref:uncharacterized protein LOC142550277 n=1 Tax=Primulina tabacum TaxID=48773 RepID=UPI003F59CF83